MSFDDVIVRKLPQIQDIHGRHLHGKSVWGVGNNWVLKEFGGGGGTSDILSPHCQNGGHVPPVPHQMTPMKI